MERPPSTAQRRAAFRAILAGNACIHPASVHDPIAGRIASDLGFEAAMFAGSVGSLTVLGAPDIIVLTLSEFADQARRICRGGAPPLLVDADHGYGNALNVMRTVEELETAGIAALTIEDTDLPRGHGVGEPGLLSLEAGLGKMRAAVAAREDAGLTVIARTSAVNLVNLDEAVRRTQVYAASGVDALFYTGVSDWDQLAAIQAVARGLPIVLGGTPPAMSDKAKLAAHGVRVALQGHQPFAAAVAAIHATLKALRDGTPPAELKGVAPAALMKQVTREADYAAATRDFL
ncbi:isocitrate lyase/PEP mutase family protein [Roseomonas terrae]|jgi:carboxyvinyl-carboxyphosphonate phosphorylmutase|uniref:Isocitrate lyase/PEP mutase family protein n=1 Tax=Neoroseomonas terrae TaxID=424799 RepID=A0ABS5EH37_9PROT|nr:isocitrate lyase/PEP mutase family protein [Neoroseomonas terrae]MBR0650326.1 isocitrate lyase/PEP mutase family protein [Neoroseomonas terrae]